MENRRDVFAKGLSPLYLPKYELLCANLSDIWQPYYGIRSIQEQDKLYLQGREDPGKIVTEARGGESPHNYGCATDWTIWDKTYSKPTWMGVKDPRWQEYIDAIKKAGLFWGGDFKNFKDIDHNELKISVSWTRIYEIMKKEGLASAVDEIELVMV